MKSMFLKIKVIITHATPLATIIQVPTLSDDDPESILYRLIKIFFFVLIFVCRISCIVHTVHTGQSLFALFHQLLWL